MVQLLHEGDDVAALTTPEAVVGTHLGADVEGRGPLVVEGTQPLPRADPRGLQGDVGLDHFLDVGALAYLIDVFPLDESGHVTQFRPDPPTP
ncbi:hypothetical protein MN0502_11470 [Arthrobacter sp. MN05-02]|nr:hypothetical protein MN0502_11470 [Arthrobacter sp. MN05-02]